MKKILTILLILAILLVACGKTETVSVEEPDGKVTEPSTVKVYKQGDSPSVATPKPAVSGPSSLPREIKEIFAKSSKVSSVEYSYAEFESGSEGFYASYAIKGDNMKVMFNKGQGKMRPGSRYNVVYIDLDSGSAVGYCEDDPDDCNEIGDAAVYLDIDDFLKETPWSLKDDITSAEKSGSGVWDSKDTVMIERPFGDNTQKIWIWDYRGLPLKYEISDPDENLVKKVEFKKMIVNQVRDSEVTR